MNKITSLAIGISIVFSALFAGPAAFATTATTCESIGETVYKGDPRYLAKLDKDADGRICESATVQLPVNGTPIPEGQPSNQYGPAEPARDTRTCAEVGRTKIPVGDPDYSLARDRDRDGFACDLGPDYSTNRQVDASGNLVQLDSNGDPIKVDENGKPIQADKLANTGASGIVLWAVVGGLALATGLFFLRRAKTQ